MTWKLHEVSDIDATIDDSGLYVVINRVVTRGVHKEYAGEIVTVRADLMQTDPSGGPTHGLVSFVGKANAVRKHLIRFIVDNFLLSQQSTMAFSSEHASYIGYELLRAENTEGYVQD